MEDFIYLVALHYIWFSNKQLYLIFFSENYKINYKIFFEKISYNLLKSFYFSDIKINTIINNKKKINLKYLKKIIKKFNINIITIYDNNYPKNLKNIPNPPYLIYIIWKIDNSPNISIVWSRNMTNYWLYSIWKIVPILSRYFTIISWWAIWCDTEVHKICINNNWNTIVVLWTWININYPIWNSKLYTDIIKKWWAIISIFPIDELWSKYSFPIRNEIIAWLSLWTLIIEAKEKSWTLITANLSLDLWRDLFVIPWDISKISSIWCNNLIKYWHGKLVTCVQDILEEYNICKNIPKIIDSNYNKNIIDPIEKNIYWLLFSEALTIDEIIIKSNFDLKTILFKLSMLEIQWIIRKWLWGKYEII